MSSNEFYKLALKSFNNREYKDAAVCLQKCLEKNPTHQGYLKLILKCLSAERRFSECTEYLQTLRHDRDIEAINLKISILNELKHYQEIEELLWQEYTLTKSNLTLFKISEYRTKRGNFEGSLELLYKIHKKDPEKEGVLAKIIINEHFSSSVTQEKIRTLQRRWEEKYAYRAVVPAHTARDKQKQLRVGILSDGFHNHPVARMTSAGFLGLPKNAFHLYAYSTAETYDHMTEPLRAGSQKWRDIKDLGDKDLNQLIRDDKIDILFDLSGYHKGSRLRALSLKPAPIIIKWVGGLLNTMGLSFIDYLLTDNIESPINTDDDYAEKLIRMPDSYICYTPPFYAPNVTPPPALSSGVITFGCFNNGNKVNDVTLQAWGQILSRVENSTLLLKGSLYESDEVQKTILAAFEKFSIDNDRIIFEGHSDHIGLLQTYNRIDITLDPWPFSGGLTTLESLLMGVPVVTLPGPTFASRHSASHVTHAGFPQLVAQSWDHYVDLATLLARDVDLLKTLRTEMRDIFLNSPICDGRKFSRNLASSLLSIWDRYCDGLMPESLSFKGSDPIFLDEVRPRPIASRLSSEQLEFSFELDRPIVVVDHGARLLTDAKFTELYATNSLHVVCFDPANLSHDIPLPLNRKHLQIVNNYILGSGQTVEFLAELENRDSGTLPPVTLRGGNRIATIPFPSVRLDDIPSDQTIDWVMLSKNYENRVILQNGINTIQNALVVSVQITMSGHNDGRMNFDGAIQMLGNLGFEFYTMTSYDFENVSSTADFPNGYRGSKVSSAIAVFIRKEVASLHTSALHRMLFILHSFFGAFDLVHRLLEEHDTERVEHYARYFEKNSSSPGKTETSGHNLPGRLVVSLTSYNKRFPWLHLTLQSLLKQSVKPDRLVLWIAHEDRPHLPDDVKKLDGNGVDICYCDNLRSYKKIIPTLKQEGDSFIVICDDDVNYPPTWLETLVKSWSGDFNEVVAGRAHKMVLDSNGSPAPYETWKWNYSDPSDRSPIIFPTGIGGVLFPPGAFHSDVFKEEVFLELCPTADDFWLYWMCARNGKVFRTVSSSISLRSWEGSQECSLWNSNKGGGNDAQFKKVIRHYRDESRKFFRSVKRHLSEQQSASSAIIHDGLKVYFHLPNPNDHIQRIIKNTRRFYEQEMLEDISKRAKNGGIIVDVGANIGNHTVFFGLFCQAERVYSFEPQDGPFTILLKNVAINGLSSKVKCLKAGLGSKSGFAAMGKVDARNLGMTMLHSSGEGNIPIYTLDSVLTEEGTDESISIMKIDVEGMELEVLRGAESRILRDKPHLYIEAPTESEFKEIERFLAPLGYNAQARFNATATYRFSIT